MRVLTVDPDETWTELVQRIASERQAPIPTDEETDFILWNLTAFPFDRPERIAEQVDRLMVKAAP